MSLSQEEKDQLSSQISNDLSQTPYACKSITPLSGGTANFVFRGTLDNNRSIIIKHSTNFASTNRNFPFDVSRCIFEQSMLKALHDFSHQVRTPHLLLFQKESNTQVQEDFPDTIDLKSRILSGELSRSVAISIGHALGDWLRAFHTWSSTQTLLKNEPMQKLKHLVTYESFITVLERFPNVFKDHRTTLDKVKEFATKELQSPTEDWGTIHGDFWAGNVLISNALSQDSDLFVIDWELSRFGHRAYDLGEMIGNLNEPKLKASEAALWIMKGLIDGYGPVSDDMAFRIAIHAGVHLICWCIRGNPKDTQERMEDVVRTGMNFVLKGWEKDRKWFESSGLAALFHDARRS